MGTRQKQLVILTVLGLLWVGLLAWQWTASEDPVRVPLTNVTGPATAPSVSRSQAESLRVRLDLLSTSRTQRELAFATPRNIFALPKGTGVAAVTPGPGIEGSERQQIAAAELAQFHYLGFVRTGEEWETKQDLAILTKHDDLHVVKKGQTVENRVVVKTITEESVTLLDRDSRVEHTVLLSEEPVSTQ